MLTEKQKEQTKEQFNNKKLLSVKEFCEYLSIGKTLGRQLLHEPNCPYAFRLNGRLFANKTELDKWIDQNTGI